MGAVDSYLHSNVPTQAALVAAAAVVVLCACFGCGGLTVRLHKHCAKRIRANFVPSGGTETLDSNISIEDGVQIMELEPRPAEHVFTPLILEAPMSLPEPPPVSAPSEEAVLSEALREHQVCIIIYFFSIFFEISNNIQF